MAAKYKRAVCPICKRDTAFTYTPVGDVLLVKLFQHNAFNALGAFERCAGSMRFWRFQEVEGEEVLV